MNDSVIIQQVYKRFEWPENGPYLAALDLVNDRHTTYANKWNIDYMVVRGEVNLKYLPQTGGWAKLDLIRKALTDGYKYVVWVDADAMIVDMDTDLRTGCPEGVGVVLHTGPGTPGPHYNVGVMLMQNSEKVKLFFDEWVSRYPGTNQFPWYEQGELWKMSHDPKWQDVVIPIENKWNSCQYANTHVDNAVIEGWHGMGNTAQRFDQMKVHLAKLEKEGK